MNSRASWYMLGAGLLAGAAVALLYAPQAGHQSRRDLRKKGSRIFREVEASSGRAYDNAKSVVRGAQKLGGDCLSSMAAPVNLWRRVASR